MARYTDESRERVRDAVDFAEIVGARTELKRAGVQRLQGLCPFHEERTPSFGIDPVEKVYYCFGCSAGGDVFRFVMETEGLDFGAALESLAERYNVQLERETEDPREAERRQRRERLYALLERTAAYYVRVLWESPEAAFAREYLEQRGLREDALRAYRVGYAPDAYDRVLLGSQRAGYSTDELLAAGLIQPSRGRAGYIDRFRGRVTFPLTDVKGHVLGFGARAMKPDQQPKYLNTSDGEIFHKSQVVYGQDMARAAAARAGRVVLVEGYTDVIALHQAGVPEVVAQMGTALTDAQINAVAKLAPKALFCQDPDRAGQESVARGIAALRGVNADRTTRGVEFRIVRLPAKQDPADVVQHSGADAMRELLAKAVEIERFEVERALEQPDASRDDMLAMTTPLIASLPASVLREDLIQLVANRLGIRPEVIMEVVRGASAAPRPRPRGTGASARGTATGATANRGAAADAIATGHPRRRRSRSTRARRSSAASAARRPSSPTASRCRSRATRAWPTSTSTTTSPRPRPARPPRTSAAGCARPTPTCPRATRTSRASWPSSPSRRTGSRRRPRSSSSRRSSSSCTGSSAASPRPGCPATRAASGRSRPSANECGTSSGISSAEQHFSVRHTN